MPGHGRYSYSVAFNKETWTKDHDVDIVAQFVAACRKFGVSPGFYLNLGINMFLNFGADSNSHSVDPSGRFASCSMDPTYGPLRPGQLNVTREEYFAVVMEMMTELFTQYGAISEVWFDGGVPYELADPLSDLLDSLQPNAVSFQGEGRSSFSATRAARHSRCDGHVKLPQGRIDTLVGSRGTLSGGPARNQATRRHPTCGPPSSKAHKARISWRMALARSQSTLRWTPSWNSCRRSKTARFKVGSTQVASGKLSCRLL